MGIFFPRRKNVNDRPRIFGDRTDLLRLSTTRFATQSRILLHVEITPEEISWTIFVSFPRRVHYSTKPVALSILLGEKGPELSWKPRVPPMGTAHITGSSSLSANSPASLLASSGGRKFVEKSFHLLFFPSTISTPAVAYVLKGNLLAAYPSCGLAITTPPHAKRKVEILLETRQCLSIAE